MTYKENMNWLLKSTGSAASEAQRGNREVANILAKRSTEEGKFLQKMSNSAAALIAKGHQQWRAGEQSKAIEDQYKESVNWNPNSEEAQAIAKVESDATLSDIKKQDLGVQARQEGVSPTLVNHYTGKSDAYLAQVAKMKLAKLGGQYEAFVQSELINNDTVLTIPATATTPAVNFKINETSGLPDPTARAMAHRALRQKFFQENLTNPKTGDAYFSEGFLNHAGFFKAIVAKDGELSAKWQKESDIAHSAHKRFVASKNMGTEKISAESVDNYIKATANGVDEEGNFIGYEKAWEMFEAWIVDASQNYDIDQLDLIKLEGSKIPSDPKTKKYPNGRTYAQKYTNRFGPEGTISQKLHKARKGTNQRENERQQITGDTIVREGWQEYIESDDKLSKGAEIRSRIISEAPHYDISKWDELVENKSSSAQVDDTRIKQVLDRFRKGELVDLSQDNYVVTSNEDVKKAKEHSERIKKSPGYKKNFESVEAFLKANDANGGYGSGPYKPLRTTSGITVQYELEQMFHKFALEEEALRAEYKQAGIKYEGVPTANAAQRVKAVWEKNGGGDVNNTDARYYINPQTGSYPNIEREVKGNLTHNLKKRREQEAEITEKVKQNGDGDVEKALESTMPWVEVGGETFRPGVDTPPDEWNINTFLEANTINGKWNGKWPPNINSVSQATGRPQFQIAQARQKVWGFEEIPIEYNPTPNQIIENSLTPKEEERLRTGTTPTLKIIENGKFILNSIMETQDVDKNEAIHIFMRELYGPVGQEFSFLSDDAAKNSLSFAIVSEYLQVSNTALDDFEEGSGEIILDAVNNYLAEGGDPHELLTTPTGKMLMAQSSGDLTFLLKLEEYRKLVKSDTSQLEPTAEPKRSGLADKVQPLGAPTGHPMATQEHQDPQGREITYTNSIPKQHHGLQEGDTFTDNKGKKWVLIVTSGSGGTVTLGRKRSK